MSSSEEGQVISAHTIAEWKVQKEKLDASGKLGIVDLTASWCGPCRVIAPVFEELAKKFSGVVFLKVDVDELKVQCVKNIANKVDTFTKGMEVEAKKMRRTVAALEKQRAAMRVDKEQDSRLKQMGDSKGPVDTSEPLPVRLLKTMLGKIEV